MTEKHFLMGVGLYNITGQKYVVDTANKLGHSISYSKTCQIETSQAQATIYQPSKILPLQPKNVNVVLTHFRVEKNRHSNRRWHC